ncbi:cytochrome P450 [Rhodopirellula rubra]|uniref:Cytochrome P450 n=1 Tax=Aporhodopirellula rubra TaxID=980271 RepID=A0A7W5DUJ8_9BACT|nr:cytochrome P450 [Aporhodopirellula rubra]MBB3204806.1 cytochrome P450 [Aporhodopirellula rubra]
MRNLTRFMQDHVPGYRRITRLPKQLFAVCPFEGDCTPSRVRLFDPGSDRPTQPFPHRWNFQDPVQILESYFWNADAEEGPGRHNRYLDVPGFAPVLVTRDPGMIRAIATATGDREGQFDRDTLPSVGIARATGTDTLLYANGAEWKKQRKIAACPFGKTTLFQPEQFCEFADTFRATVRSRIDVLRQHLTNSGADSVEIPLEPEVKVVMLEMLTNNFFGAEISYDELREKYVPALERVIDHIVSDTVKNRFGIPWRKFPSVSDRIVRAKEDDATFEELTGLILAPRGEQKALWRQFKSEAPDAKLVSNLKVFLAGALEATTSYATWAISHLARHPESQERVYEEVKDIDVYTPEVLAGATYLRAVLDETLRLTPSLYFLPRRATTDTWVTAADGRKLLIPWGTHLLLDVWHANRHEDHWGVEASGYPATTFEPDRWRHLRDSGRATKDILHFGFGHGPRVCPGKHLGELEVGLTVGAFVKTFRFTAAQAENPARAGVSTKPADGTRVRMSLR